MKFDLIAALKFTKKVPEDVKNCMGKILREIEKENFIKNVPLTEERKRQK